MPFVGYFLIALCLIVFLFNLICGILYLKHNKKLIDKKSLKVEKMFFIKDKDTYFKTLGNYKLAFATFWLFGSILAFYMDRVNLRFSWLILMFLICINFMLQNRFQDTLKIYLEKKQ